MDNRTRLLLASVISIATTSFGFIVRALLLNEWGDIFNLTETQKGALQGAGLFPFAVSIILVSLVVDRFGYGRMMAVAWVGHVSAALITMTAASYTQLYIGTLIFALANGIVEGVTNPAVATLYPKDKVRYLNILHAGWPGGLMVAGILFIAMGGTSWELKIGLFLLPAVVYGVMMLGCKFPVQERVSAGVSFDDMMREFGWAGCLIVAYFVALAADAVGQGIFGLGLPTWAVWAITLVPTAIFAFTYKAAGRPVFLYMLLIMIVLATTELGTDSWVAEMLTPVLGDNAAWVLVYTSAIMFVLRIVSSGPLVKALTPVGLLLVCSVMAAGGLLMLSGAGNSGMLVFLAATLYGVGKTFFWPTTLGIVAEQFPRGGALTLNAMGGMGMIAVGALGAPFLGAIQDQNIDNALRGRDPALHAQAVRLDPATGQPAPSTFQLVRGLDAGPTTVGPYLPLDGERQALMVASDRATVGEVVGVTKQHTLTQFAYLPMIMAVAYLLLFVYYRSQGGYKVEILQPTGLPTPEP